MKKILINTFLISLVIWIAWVMPARLEHLNSNEDLFGVIFGSARQMIGQGALTRADLYYHGGIGHADGEECNGHDGCSHADAEKCNNNQGHECDHNHEKKSVNNSFSPWIWLNNRLHPRSPRHMNTEREATEVLPWLWLAIKAEPNNIDNLELAVFWLKRTGKEVNELIDFLVNHGNEDNINNAQYRIALAELYLQAGKKVEADKLLGGTLDRIIISDNFKWLNLHKRFAIIAKQVGNAKELSAVCKVVIESPSVDEGNKIRMKEFCGG